MKIVLTIGGSDPTSGAGIQMDLKVFHKLGVYGLSIITVITAQNTKKVKTIQPLSKEIINDQFETLLTDVKPNGAKIGLLFSKDIAECVVENVKKFNIKNLVIDPIVISTTGNKLIQDKALKIFKEELIPISRAVTANVPEAEILTGIKIKKIEDIYKSAEKLYQMGTKIAIIKGGHFNKEVPDILYNGKKFYTIKGEKIPGEFHGTGCVFSSAFLSFICLGYKPVEALKASKEFTKKAIKDSFKLGHGINLLKIL